MKKLKIVIISLLVTLIVSGCTASTPKAFSYVASNGSFHIGEDGAIPLSETQSETYGMKASVDMFFEPMCGSCMLYESTTKDVIDEALATGEVEVVYHPMMFLNEYLEGTAKDYSWDASAYTLSIAEHAPTKVRDFIKILMSEETQLTVGGEKFNKSEFFKGAMTSIEISEDVQKLITKDLKAFKTIAVKSTEEFTGANSEWLKFTNESDEDGPYVYTPFILVNRTGERASIAQNFHELDKLAPELKASIDKILNAE